MSKCTIYRNPPNGKKRSRGEILLIAGIDKLRDQSDAKYMYDANTFFAGDKHVWYWRRTHLSLGMKAFDTGEVRVNIENARSL